MAKFVHFIPQQSFSPTFNHTLATQALLLEAFKKSPPLPNVIGVAANPKSILSVIAANVAPEHGALVQNAVDSVERITKLFDYVKAKSSTSKGEQINTDSDLLKMIVDFEASDLLDRKSKGENIGGFSKKEIAAIYEDFISIKELLSGLYFEQTKVLCHLKGHYFLTIDEVKELKTIEPEARESFLLGKTAGRVFPLWYLVVSLCRLLQQGENTFTAHDAWYFGLIDEVAGSDLPSLRKWRALRATANPPSTIPAAPSSEQPLPS
jgi:hypothetical protein